MSLISSRSWIAAGICSVLNFLHLGMARLSGTLYLAVLERYQVDRSKASLPFVLCYTVRNISGPLVGYLATKFGIYTVTMLGGLIAFVGIGCCYFAEDIIVIIMFWGVVFGIGFGMGSVLIPEIINQHFDRYISNANGVAFGGECIAGFVLPIFLKFSLNTFGTSGTFLILSGLMLNSIPATLLLKYLSHNHQSSKTHQRVQSRENLNGGNGLHCSINLTSNDSFEIEGDDLPETEKLLRKRESNEFIGFIDSKIESEKQTRDIIHLKNSNFKAKFACPEKQEHGIPDLKQRIRTANQLENGKNSEVHQPVDVQTLSSNNQDPKTATFEDNLSHSYPERRRKYEYATLLESNISYHSNTKNACVPKHNYGSLDQGIQNFGNSSAEKVSPSNPLVASYENSSGRFSSHDNAMTLSNVPLSSLLAKPSPLVYEQTSASSPFKIFLDPAFCMILLTQSTMLFNATLFWTIIVDFSRDTGLSSKEEIYVLICLSVFDMIGRLGLGWITDAGYVSNSTFSGVCCFGMSISVGILVFLRKVAEIGCSVSVFGLCFGGFLIVCAGMVNDHIPQDKRGMALASRFFLFAPMSLSQSLLIGHFRGKLGSYRFIFIIVAILCLFSSVTSLLTPYAEKYREGRKNRSNGISGRNFDAIVSTAGSTSQYTQIGFTRMEK